MNVVKRLKLGDDERQEIKRVVEACNMARNFFEDDEFKAVNVIGQGHELSQEHLTKAQAAIDEARGRVVGTDAHAGMPTELREQYIKNLYAASVTVGEWMVPLR